MRTIIKLNRIMEIPEDEMAKHLADGWKLVEMTEDEADEGEVDEEKTDAQIKLEAMSDDELRIFAAQHDVNIPGNVSRRETIINLILQSIQQAGGE